MPDSMKSRVVEKVHIGSTHTANIRVLLRLVANQVMMQNHTRNDRSKMQFRGYKNEIE